MQCLNAGKGERRSRTNDIGKLFDIDATSSHVSAYKEPDFSILEGFQGCISISHGATSMQRSTGVRMVNHSYRIR